MSEKKVTEKEGKLVIDAEYEIKVIGKDGKVRQTLKGKSHSLVRNALRYLYGQMTAQDIALRDLANALKTAPFSGTSAINLFHWKARIGCGTSNTAFGFDQYNLIAEYAHLDSLSITAYLEEDSTGYWDVTAGIPITSSVTIWEIALFGSVPTVGIFMLARDVLGAGVSLSAGDTLAVTYKLRTQSV